MNDTTELQPLSKQDQLIALLNTRDAFNQIETRNVFSQTVTGIRNNLQLVINSLQAELGTEVPSGGNSPEVEKSDNPLASTTSQDESKG